MDAMDVLGALLGKKANHQSPGGKILNDILGGSPKSSQPSSTRRTHPRTNRAPSSSPGPTSIGEAARELEDLLGVSYSRHESSSHESSRHQKRYPQQSHTSGPSSRNDSTQNLEEESTLNAQSVVLIRAMISASKADGQVDGAEQQSIIEQLGHLAEAETRFLQEEFRKASGAREMAWNTPIGMEDQVYTMSLIAIDLDEQKEAEYLAELAHGLRLSPEHCNRLHRKYDAPEIFRESRSA